MEDRATPDHQPARALNEDGRPFNFYPHCKNCKAKQGGQVRQELRRRRARGAAGMAALGALFAGMSSLDQANALATQEKFQEAFNAARTGDRSTYLDCMHDIASNVAIETGSVEALYDLYSSVYYSTKLR